MESFPRTSSLVLNARCFITVEQQMDRRGSKTTQWLLRSSQVKQDIQSRQPETCTIPNILAIQQEGWDGSSPVSRGINNIWLPTYEPPELRMGSPASSDLLDRDTSHLTAEAESRKR